MENEELEEPQQEQPLVIYSKTAILIFSIFFTPVAGGALLMLNLRRINRNAEGALILFSSIAYYFLSGMVISNLVKLPKLDPNHPDLKPLIKPLCYSLIPTIIGAGILAEYFFKKYFPDDDYERRSVGPALLVAIVISFSLTMLFGF